MNTQLEVPGAPGKLDTVTKKWWLYLFLLLLFFTPAYATKSYDPQDSMELIGQVLSAPLIFAFPVLMPIAKFIPVILIIGVLIYGNKVRRLFNAYVALLYLALAFFQTTAITEVNGLVIISGNLVLILIVAVIWVWETVAQRNDFSVRKHPMWKYWVAPLALIALLSPVDASRMSPDFNLLRLLTNEAGLTYCMMTPLVLAVLIIFFPTVNPGVLRISSFTGMIFGAINMVIWFVMEPWGWWMGVMHIPLLVISVFAFVLAHYGRRA